ncbi:hypothetical protein GCM10010515_30610 [Streptomyces fructofermentans]|uniref:Uncharacterized protein n=1 Tax=Streptomyces fructofermentans TaxID=152141 RepID=A0A918KGI5_9ACTN|nr:hypothetical protein GCM10010515_30610 [Streptomyces fructofermentans]
MTGVREERKLNLKLVVTARFQWRFESSPRHQPASVRDAFAPRWPNWQRQTAINLRLLLQSQHSPPIAGSTGLGLRASKCRFKSGSHSSMCDGPKAGRGDMTLT